MKEVTDQIENALPELADEFSLGPNKIFCQCTNPRPKKDMRLLRDFCLKCGRFINDEVWIYFKNSSLAKKH